MSYRSMLGSVVAAVGLLVIGEASLASPAVVPSTPAGIMSRSLDAVRRLAVLHNGRLKPFDSYARETLQLVTGGPALAGQDPVATVLSIAADPSSWTEAKIIAVPFVPLRQRLGLGERVTHVSYNELVETKALMRMLPDIVAKQQREEKLTMLENETMDAFNRFVAFTGLLQQNIEVVPPAASGAVEWMSVSKTPLKDSWQALLSAFQRGDGAGLTTSAQMFAQATRGVSPGAYPAAWRLELEVLYNHAAPFAIARLLYAIAAVLLMAGGMRAAQGLGRVGLRCCLAAAAVHASGILTRVVVGGRPPVSNFYETMLWLPFVAIALALVFERVYRVGFFALSASIVAGVMLLLADYVPLDSSISPVVAVLHSNLWLTVHVLTVVASYGALALAAVLAHVYAVSYLRRSKASALKSLELCVYRTIQVGVVLLAGGIMLGAVWANASWGRYWGWDPKETWALITLLWFLAVLHGRSAGWIDGVGTALSTIGGFFLLLMTYYGVSFYLVGLHSYAGGHATPPPPLLVGYVVAELLFLGMVGGQAYRRRMASLSRGAASS